MTAQQLLNYSSILIPLLGIFYMAIYRPCNFMLTFLVYMALSESTLNLIPFQSGIDFAGVNFYIGDFFLLASIAGILITSTNECKEFNGHGTLFLRLTYFQASLVVLACISWISTYGIQAGLNAWRWALTPIFFTVYILRKVRKISKNEIYTLLSLPGIFLACITLFRFLTKGIGSYGVVDLITGETQRATTAAGAFAIWMSIIGIYYFAPKRGLLQILILFSLFLIVLLLQHRSVWTSVLAGIFVMILHQPKTDKISRTAKYLFFTLTALCVVIIAHNNSVLTEAASSTGTFDWRVRRWKSSMATSRSIVEWVFGSVLGPTPVTNLKNYKIFAHSTYVNQIEFFGYLGLLLLFLIFFVLWRIQSKYTSLGVALRALILSGVLYGLSYGITVMTFCGFALLCANNEKESWFQDDKDLA